MKSTQDKIKILVIDDMQKEYERFQQTLPTTRFELLYAMNGVDAKKLAQEADAIILDQNFEVANVSWEKMIQEDGTPWGKTTASPDMKMNACQGLYILRYLRKEGIYAPVIFCTSQAQSDLGHQARKLGAARYMTKDSFLSSAEIATNEILRLLGEGRLEESRITQWAIERGLILDDLVKWELRKRENIWRREWAGMVLEFLDECVRRGLSGVLICEDTLEIIETTVLRNLLKELKPRWNSQEWEFFFKQKSIPRSFCYHDAQGFWGFMETNIKQFSLFPDPSSINCSAWQSHDEILNNHSRILLQMQKKTIPELIVMAPQFLEFTSHDPYWPVTEFSYWQCNLPNKIAWNISMWKSLSKNPQDYIYLPIEQIIRLSFTLSSKEFIKIRNFIEDIQKKIQNSSYIEENLMPQIGLVGINQNGEVEKISILCVPNPYPIDKKANWNEWLNQMLFKAAYGRNPQNNDTSWQKFYQNPSLPARFPCHFLGEISDFEFQILEAINSLLEEQSFHQDDIVLLMGGKYEASVPNHPSSIKQVDILLISPYFFFVLEAKSTNVKNVIKDGENQAMSSWGHILNILKKYNDSIANKLRNERKQAKSFHLSQAGSFLIIPDNVVKSMQNENKLPDFVFGIENIKQRLEKIKRQSKPIFSMEENKKITEHFLKTIAVNPVFLGELESGYQILEALSEQDKLIQSYRVDQYGQKKLWQVLHIGKLEELRQAEQKGNFSKIREKLFHAFEELQGTYRLNHEFLPLQEFRYSKYDNSWVADYHHIEYVHLSYSMPDALQKEAAFHKKLDWALELIELIQSLFTKNILLGSWNIENVAITCINTYNKPRFYNFWNFVAIKREKGKEFRAMGIQTLESCKNVSIASASTKTIISLIEVLQYLLSMNNHCQKILDHNAKKFARTANPSILDELLKDLKTLQNFEKLSHKYNFNKHE